MVLTYVPNAGEGLKRIDYRTNEWDKDFEKYLDDLRDKKPVILTGDLNVAHKEIDLFDPRGQSYTPGFTDREKLNFSNLL